jgi:hypothetical protein
MSDDLPDELSFVELVGFPHVEGALGLVARWTVGTGVREAPSKKDQLEVGPEGSDRVEPALAGCE